MIVAFSTSSPKTSVAIIDGNKVIAQQSREAPRAASSACLALLDECLASAKISLSDVTLFCADIGPGSFTGTRVGVIMAKTLAMDRECLCAGATSFDLIDPCGDVYIPSKKGEFILREAGREPVVVQNIPASVVRGYGKEGSVPTYPYARGFADIIERLERMEPERLMPYYFHEPSISKPNKPYRIAGGVV